MRFAIRRIRPRDRVKYWLGAALLGALACLALPAGHGLTRRDSLLVGLIVAVLCGSQALAANVRRRERLATLRTWRAARAADAGSDWPPAPWVSAGRVCPHCRRPVASDAKMCPACGTRLLVPGRPSDAQTGCLVLLAMGLGLLGTCAAGPVLGGLAGVFHDSPFLFMLVAAVTVVLTLIGRDAAHNAKFRGYGCQEYLTPAFRGGLFDKQTRQWLILPVGKAYVRDGFLVISPPRVDGIGWGYRRGKSGLWMYEPGPRKFRHLAPTLAALVDQWKAKARPG